MELIVSPPGWPTAPTANVHRIIALSCFNEPDNRIFLMRMMASPALPWKVQKARQHNTVSVFVIILIEFDKYRIRMTNTESEANPNNNMI